jgi:hypothetical protein
MEVYEFAHQFQITSLMHAVNEFFKTIGPIGALEAYEFCKDYENEQGLHTCEKVRQSN